MLTVYIGFDGSDYGQVLANTVCYRSIKAHEPNAVVKSLHLSGLKRQGIYKRPDDSRASTEFTYTRFLVPTLNENKGLALFCDSDFLWRCSPYELEQSRIDAEALVCVKHDYTRCPTDTKMGGIKQEWYPRKNWSSLMLFDCEHPQVRALTPQRVNTLTPAVLHRMLWLTDSVIGSMSHTYNYLINYYDDIDDPKVVHWTDGGPWYKDQINAPFADEWRDYLTKQEKDRLKEEQGL